MRITQNEKTCQVISSSGEELNWDISAFYRAQQHAEVEDVFRDINGYLNWLSPQRRQHIFAIYQAMHDIIKRVDNMSNLSMQLTEKVEALYNEVPLEEVDHWLRFYGNIMYPESTPLEHSPTDPMPERTYLKSDYHDLVVMTTALRLMVPIWGEYIEKIKKQVGTQYKEYIAVRLLSRSVIIECPALQRLVTYIECFVTRDTDSKSAIIAGLSTSELPEWLLSIILVRRLAVGEVDVIEDKRHIVSNVYRFIDNTLKELPTKFGNVREKYPEDSDEDESSILESYRVKEQMTAGMMGTFNVYARDPIRMALGVDSTLPVWMVQQCSELVDSMQEMTIVKPHVVLVQWVMQGVMSPHAIPGMSKQGLIRAMVATQAVLWHWGFTDLALLATADVMPATQSLQMSDSRTRVPTALVEKLNEYYPHMSTRPGMGNSRGQNFAYASVTALTREYIARNWRACAPRMLIDQSVGGVELSGQLIVPSTLTEQLIRLVIKLNET
jgi:hypothetical protein